MKLMVFMVSNICPLAFVERLPPCLFESVAHCWFYSMQKKLLMFLLNYPYHLGFIVFSVFFFSLLIWMHVGMLSLLQYSNIICYLTTMDNNFWLACSKLGSTNTSKWLLYEYLISIASDTFSHLYSVTSSHYTW